MVVVSSDCTGSSIGNIDTILAVGRLYSPVGVFIVTTQTRPSFPGCIAMILANGYFVGTSASSFTSRHNISNSCVFRLG